MNNEIVLDWPPKECSPNARVHWSKRAKAGARYFRDCWALTLKSESRVTWDGPIKVVMTFYPPSQRRFDLDNAIASAKHGLDGIAEALGVDDVRFQLYPSMSPAVRKGGAVVVRISRGAE